MYRRRRPAAFAALLAASALTFAACGDDEETPAAAESTPAAASDVSLAGVCPATVVLQTDWHPEVDHSEAYNLLGGDIVYDKAKKRVTGDLMASGKPTGVKIEVRAGGPAVGFASPTQQMYTDKDITLGYLNTDESVQNSEKFPMVAIMAPREKWAQILMYDPNTYDFKTIADIGKTDTKVLYFKGNVYMDYLVGAGILKKDQVDSSYDGKPARFVTSGGKVVQQGFVTAEPYSYEKVITKWGKPVATLPIADAGYPNYGEAIGVRQKDITENKACLEKLVPILQQSQVDYIADPKKANDIIVEAAKTYANGWEYPLAMAEAGYDKQLSEKIIDNGADDTLGNLEEGRISEMIKLVSPIYEKQNIKVKEGLTAADLFTNEFIDESIGLPAAGQ